MDDSDRRFYLRLAAEVTGRRILRSFTVPPVMIPRAAGRWATGSGSDDEWADTLDFVFGP